MVRYSKEKPLRVFTAFSGYDSQCLALERLKAKREGFDYELVGWSEIEPSAIKAHNLLFPQWADRNFGDISKIDWEIAPDFDLFTYSSPCTDFSTAGLQRGGAEGSGTRSSLLWECRRAIVAKRPAYCMLENVKALVSRKFLPLFQKWCDELEGYGYTTTGRCSTPRTTECRRTVSGCSSSACERTWQGISPTATSSPSRSHSSGTWRTCLSQSATCREVTTFRRRARLISASIAT